MIYTVRFAHLATAPLWKVGDIIKRGDVIGVMGKTGKCYGAHLHFDAVNGRIARRYTLADMENGNPSPCPKQLNYFIDEELFGGDFKITTPYADYDYQNTEKKLHLAYDIIPIGSDWRIRWNRKNDGEVIFVDYDPVGYGHFIHIASVS